MQKFIFILTGIIYWTSLNSQIYQLDKLISQKNTFDD